MKFKRVCEYVHTHLCSTAPASGRLYVEQGSVQRQSVTEPGALLVIRQSLQSLKQETAVPPLLARLHSPVLYLRSKTTVCQD